MTGCWRAEGKNPEKKKKIELSTPKSHSWAKIQDALPSCPQQAGKPGNKSPNPPPECHFPTGCKPLFYPAGNSGTGNNCLEERTGPVLSAQPNPMGILPLSPGKAAGWGSGTGVGRSRWGISPCWVFREIHLEMVKCPFFSKLFIEFLNPTKTWEQPPNTGNLQGAPNPEIIRSHLLPAPKSTREVKQKNPGHSRCPIQP